ncbi:MAG: peptidase M56 BlaR1 [Coriobacteriia bacterium]|nr:peptidase M56 BlaR1 [Coriobacteriia bacterium]
MSLSSRKRARPRRRIMWAAVTLGLVIGVVAGGMTIAGAFDSPPAPNGPAVTDWPVNARGMTYGSALQAMSPEDEPDLIQVIATNGRVGYALRSDLDGPVPSTPQEAVRQQPTGPGHNRVVPVYEADGITKIGVFIIETGAPLGD